MLRRGDTELCNSKTEIANILADCLCQSYTVELPALLPKIPSALNHAVLDQVTFSKEKINYYIATLDKNSAPGVDNITSISLKECASEVVGPLSLIMT